MNHMKKKPLGTSGLEVSAVGLGCMNFGLMCDQAATDAVVGAALDAGVNFFDVADIYGRPAGEAEAMLGRALGPRRRDIVLATKFGAKTTGGGGAALRVRGRASARTACVPGHPTALPDC